MVSQNSDITTPLSRESTSGLTIRQLPLTIRSGLGVLDKPPNYGHENIISDLQIKKPLSPPYERTGGSANWCKGVTVLET